MTKILPVEAVRTGPPLAVAHRAAGRPSRARLAVFNVASRVTLRALPKIPDRVKRLLLGGRTITIDGNTLDTTLQLMLALQRSSRVGGLVASADIAVARTQLRKLAAIIAPAIAVGVTDIALPGPAGPMRARHYIPVTTVSAEPLLLFFHGGGFSIGDIETHDGLCRLLCRDAGVHVLSVDYRLAPEHKAPAALQDSYAAYRWALEHATELGADPTRIAVGGDSAGGNLATVVSQQARNDGVQLPILQLLLYPVTQFGGETRSMTLFADGYYLARDDMDWFNDNYLSGASVAMTDPSVSPLRADDLSGLPPALLVTGGFDPLRDEGNQYAEALAAAGVAVDHRQYGSMVHAFANFFPLGGGSATAMTDVVSALRAHLCRT
ncbi:MAG TPA: alpha/beta hydrolase [Mycobacterium sp.]